MAFLLVSFCTSAYEIPIEKQHQVALLPCEETMALVTDVFLSCLAIAVGVLIIIANSGIDLGPLNGIGSLGTIAGYSLITLGIFAMSADCIKLLVQMARHISRLYYHLVRLSHEVKKSHSA